MQQNLSPEISVWHALRPEEKNALAHILSMKPNEQNFLTHTKIEVCSIVAHRDQIGSSQTITEARRLDAYANDSKIEQNPKEEGILYLEDGLNANGAFIRIKMDGGDWKTVGYSVFYPVIGEFSSANPLTPRRDLPDIFIHANERAAWPAIQEYLGRLLEQPGGNFPLEKIHHWFDYAIPDNALRRNGMGRLVLYLGLKESLRDGDAAVGFIDSTDPEHLPSVIAALSVPGTFLGPERKISPDGEHPSFLVMHLNGYKPVFTGRIITSRAEATGNLLQFADTLRRSLGQPGNENMLIAYNPENGRFELVRPQRSVVDLRTADFSR